MLAAAVIGAAGAAFVSSRYFAAALEAGLAKSLLDAKRRTLRFDGPLEIFFWPNAGFRVGRVALSEAGSAQEFAALDAARFAVAVKPLFHGHVVIEDCRVEGLRATIVKHRDGSLNIDDLFASEQPSSAAFTVDAAAVDLSHAELAWVDEASGTRRVASDLELSGSRLHADTAAKTFQADAMTAAGRVDGVKLRLGAAGVAAAPAALTAERIALGLDYRSGATAVAASLTARLAIDRAQGTVALQRLSGDLDLADPRLAKPLRLPLSGDIKAGRNAAGGELRTRVDDSSAALKLAIPRYAPPTLRFDVEIDRLDVGRYLAPNPVETAEAKSGESPLDFSALDGWELDGAARLGSLRIAGVETRNIRLEIRGRHGKLDVRGGASKGR